MVNSYELVLPKMIGISITLFAMSINVIYLTYIFHLENKICKCALNWRHEFIKYYIIVMIGILFLEKVSSNIFKHESIKILSFILSCGYFTILGQWLWKLHTSKCKCSDDWRKTFMETIYIILLVLSLLNVFI